MRPAFKPQSLKQDRVARELLQLVSGLRSGDKLPSERELARAFSCNPLTVRKAMSGLVQDERIVRRVGSGTFVTGRICARAPVPVDEGRIGLLLHSSSDAYAFEVIRALAAAAEADSVSLRTDWVKDYGPGALAKADALRADGCASLVLPWVPVGQVPQAADFVRSCPSPVVLPLLIPGLEGNCFEKPDVFGTSSVRAVEAAFRYFQKLGCERIAFLGPDTPNDVILQRNVSGYTAAASRANFEQLCGLVGETADGMDALARRWKRYRGELAVVCYDDSHASRFLTAMHKISRSAPRDFCIMGYNDTDEALRTDPPLTSMSPRYDDIARGMILSALAAAGGKTRQANSGPGLRIVARESCGGAGRTSGGLIAAMKKMGVTVEDGGAVARSKAQYDRGGKR